MLWLNFTAIFLFSSSLLWLCPFAYYFETFPKTAKKISGVGGAQAPKSKYTGYATDSKLPNQIYRFKKVILSIKF